ncbi:hypothetical protein BJV78DRAFT_1222923 [Lactifluus subvellereus]|nr:hypothetical protein BJV78DRAFT_1222923 [Lactifluus subvellereus]
MTVNIHRDSLRDIIYELAYNPNPLRELQSLTMHRWLAITNFNSLYAPTAFAKIIVSLQLCFSVSRSNIVPVETPAAERKLFWEQVVVPHVLAHGEPRIARDTMKGSLKNISILPSLQLIRASQRSRSGRSSGRMARSAQGGLSQSLRWKSSSCATERPSRSLSCTTA